MFNLIKVYLNYLYFKKCKCNCYLKPLKLNLITNIKSKFKAHKKNKNHEAMHKNNMEQKHTNS